MIIYTKKHHIAFQIDESDFHFVSQFTWSISGTSEGMHGYPQTRLPHGPVVLLHILLMGHPPQGHVWGHKNFDKLDNRKDNLELITKEEHALRRPMYKNNSSGRIGVHKTQNPKKPWKATLAGKYLGSFNTMEEACVARENAEKNLTKKK